jgi:pimeloyl-ACP methyl ester carboxylesterase
LISENDVVHTFTDVGETVIHAAEVGSGDELILIHGWHNNWYGFWLLITSLAEQYRVVAIDLPGYGESGDLEGEYSFERMANMVARFIEKRGSAPTSIAALSMGTFVTSILVRDHPQLVERTVLMGAPVHNHMSIFLYTFCFLLWCANLNQLTLKIGRRIVISRHLGHLVSRLLNMYHYDGKLVDRYGLIGKRMIRKEALFQVGREIPRCRPDHMWPTAAVPICLIYGAADKLVDRSYAQEVVRACPHMQYVEVDQAGHVVSLEKPVETAAAIKRFLAG